MLSKLVGMGVLCLLASTLVSTEKKVHGAKSESLQFTLEQIDMHKVPNITSIIWKYGEDKAAEWVKGDEEPTYYGIFKSTATLDRITGALTISNLHPHFSGKYSAQLNDVDSNQSVNLVVVDAVSIYGEKGQSILLTAEVPNGTVESAQWLCNDSVIANWDEEGSSSLQNMVLNSDHSLNISVLQGNDTGLYVLLLNNHETAISYLLTVKDVLNLVITTQLYNATHFNLKCSAANNATPPISWTDNKGRKMDHSVWDVKKSEFLDVIYTCSSHSGGWKNKSIQEKEVFAGLSVSDIAGGNVVVKRFILGAVFGAAVLIIIGIIIKYKGHIQENEDAQGQEMNIEMASLQGTEDEDGVV